MYKQSTYNRSYGRRTLADRLPSGDRRVPAAVAIGVALGNLGATISFVLLGCLMIPGWLALCGSDFTSPFLFMGGAQKVRGTVEGIHRTGAEENDRMVFGVRYSFIGPDDIQRTGESFTTGATPHVGQPVTIEYLAASPDVSRIEGMRRRWFSPWLGIALIFPIGAAFFAVRSVIGGLRGLRLLRVGKLAKARVVNKEATGTVINNQRVYKFTLEFTGDDRRTHQFFEKTHRGHLLEDNAEEVIIYDPANPEDARAVDTLPGGATVTEGGELQAGNAAMLLRAVLIPTLVVLAHGGFALFWFMLRPGAGL